MKNIIIIIIFTADMIRIYFKVSLLQAEASVIFDCELISVKDITNKIDDMGFDVTLKSMDQIEIKGTIVNSTLKINSEMKKGLENMIDQAISTISIMIKCVQESQTVWVLHSSDVTAEGFY